MRGGDPRDLRPAFLCLKLPPRLDSEGRDIDLIGLCRQCVEVVTAQENRSTLDNCAEHGSAAAIESNPAGASVRNQVVQISACDPQTAERNRTVAGYTHGCRKNTLSIIIDQCEERNRRRGSPDNQVRRRTIKEYLST